MKMPWKALFIWTLGITNCIFYLQAPSRAIRKMVCRRGWFWFCIFVSPCGLSVPTAVKLPALGAICEYPQRDGNAKGSLPFSDAFTVVEKKNEQVPLSLRTAGCHCYPAKMQVSGEPEGFSAVEDLLNRFQEQTTVGPDSAEESCWKWHLFLRPFHLCGRFPFKDKKLWGRIYCI